MQHQNKAFKDYRRLLHLYNSGAVFVALDTETTSLTPSTGRIMEIAAIKFSNKGVISEISQLINPEQEISTFTTNLTHITNSMVNNMPTMNTFIPILQDFIKDTIIIAHNAQFDLNFINAEFEKFGHPTTKNKFLDTLQICRWAYPQLKHYKLDYLAKAMELDCKNHHRAYDDAKTCMEIFLRVLKDTVSIQKT